MTTLPPKLEEAIHRANGRTFAVSGEDMDAQIAEQVAANAALVAAIREYAAEMAELAFFCRGCGGTGMEEVMHQDDNGRCEMECRQCCDPQEYQAHAKRVGAFAQEIRDGK